MKSPTTRRFLASLCTLLTGCLTSSLFAQRGTYCVHSHVYAYFNVDGHTIEDWDFSDTILEIRSNLTAVWQGEITSASLGGERYQLHFDLQDPYQLSILTAPDVNWGSFSGVLTRISDGAEVDRFYDYNGVGRYAWPNGFDAAFGQKRAEQGEWHPAPWTAGTAADGSLEFGFWTVDAFGQRNGDFNAVMTYKDVINPPPGPTPIPEAQSCLLLLLGSSLLLRRKRK